MIFICPRCAKMIGHDGGPSVSGCVWHPRCLEGYVNELEADSARLQALETLLNTPEIEDFDRALPLEAAHQVQRWGSEHDAGKEPEDWLWLLGWFAGKAVHAARAGNVAKAMHHTITAAAALRNWHAHLRSGKSTMRPGIEPPAALSEAGKGGQGL